MSIRHKRFWKGGVAAAVVGAIITLTACSSQSGSNGNDASERVSGGTLNIYTPSASVDPRQQHGPFGRSLADSLVDRDPETQEYVPWLAKEYSVNDSSTEFTFTLRDDVTFSNGEKFNAEAVKANFDGAVQDLSQGGGWYVRGIFDNYIATDVVDEYTAVVRFSQGNVPFLATLSTSQLAIIAPSEFKKTLEQRALDGIVGTGPYVIDTVVPKESVTLRRRDDYNWPSKLATHEGAASIETIQASLVSEIGVREGALRSGEADAIITPSTEGINQLSAQGYNIHYRSQVGIGMSIEINFNRPLTSDITVRRALQKAVDREAVSSLVTGEKSPAASSVITSATFGHADFSDSVLAYDPEGAKKLLDSDGWTVGKDGIREKNGQRLSLSLITWTGTEYEDIVSLIKEQYAKVGIELVLSFDALAPSVFTDSGEYDLHYRNTTRADPDVLRKVYGNSAYAGDPVILYRDSALVTSSGTELETVLQAQSVEGNADKRSELLARAQEIILEDALRVPVVDNAVYVVASSTAVHGVTHNSLSEPVFSEFWIDQ